MSINDVPIGPIRLEEMGHKIDAGAVSEYSLVWRDGFDEWRPLATVPELMGLLHERRHSGPPSRSTFSSMPPFVETRNALAEPSPPAAVPVPPSHFPAGPSLDEDVEIAPLADALQPDVGVAGLDAMSQPPAPLGPEGVFQSSPQLGSYSGLPPSADQEVSVPSAPPETAAATAEPKSGMSLGILVLILAVTVFAGVVAFLAFDRYGDELMQRFVGSAEPAAPVAAKPAPVAPEPVEQPEPEVSADAEAVAEETLVEGEGELALEEGEAAEGEEGAEVAEGAAAAETEPAIDEEEVAAEELVPPPNPRNDPPKIAPAPRAKKKRKPRPKPVAAAPVAAEPKSDVSAADQKLIDEYGSGADSAPAKIDVQNSTSSKSDKPALDGDAIRSTVTANKPKLQRCYERAIRGQQSPTAVRLDVTVNVSSSGRVKSVSSEGSGPGGLAECVEASVRRWRFPESAEGGPARFPIVFSAN